MSYQVLARKWRPKSFKELVGQEHVVRALTHALEEQRLHHAYLFTGTRGVGKTTIARILAKALNCERGISANPCGECSSCQEIDQGRFVDLLEVDAATNTRVEEMRTLLENAVYAPTRGRFKVYVIDEVHMLSTAAFNAMLKTLEEPPEHVKFILATTDPQKIPVTVLSRCLQFNLKQMTVADTIFQIKRILEKENIPFEEKALPLIARAGQGSMRDSLSLLDQAIAFGAGEIKTEQVAQMLGAIDRDFLFYILEALINQNAQQLLEIAQNLTERAVAFSSVLQEFGLLLTRLQMLQFAPKSFEDDPEIEKLKAFANQFSGEWIQLAYQIVNIGRSEMPLAPDEESGFLMTLLRLHAFRPGEVFDAAHDVVPQNTQNLHHTQTSHAPHFMDVPKRANVVPSASLPVKSAADILKMMDDEDEEERLLKNKKKSALTVEKTPASQNSHQANQPINSMPQSVPPDIPLKEVAPAQWNNIVPNLMVKSIAEQLAMNAQALLLSNHKVVLRIDEQADIFMPGKSTLEVALKRYFDNPDLKLEIEIGEVQTPTLSQLCLQKRKAIQNEAKSALEKDSFIQSAQQELDARIDWETVKALE